MHGQKDKESYIHRNAGHIDKEKPPLHARDINSTKLPLHARDINSTKLPLRVRDMNSRGEKIV
jgi:hypothetical protein